jgi:hypothetical protein
MDTSTHSSDIRVSASSSSEMIGTRGALSENSKARSSIVSTFSRRPAIAGEAVSSVSGASCEIAVAKSKPFGRETVRDGALLGS